MALGIFYPNGMVEAVQVYVWDTMTLQPVLWDGAVSFSGTISVGSVDQGAAGASPWLVSVSNFPATQPISGTVGINNFPATQPVSIATLPVGHNVIDSGVITSITNSVAVTGPLTDTQLRATPVPVSGTVTASGPLTDTQLRATPVPVSGTVTVDTSLLATSAKQDTGNNTLAEIATDTDSLIIAQGADGTNTVGPMIQALVNDVPNSYSIGAIQPISLTSEGRVRVSSVQADINQIWQNTFDNPWEDIVSVASTICPSVGEVNV